MTEQDLSIVLASLAKRAGITGKSLHPSIFRDTFAVRSLELGHNPIALWYVLGKISMTKMKEYIEMSKTSIASTKYTAIRHDTALASQSEPRVQRRRGFRFKK
jgi:site-specific recombinase XerD